MGILKVRLIKSTNVVNKDLFGKSDPYVRLELEQDNYLKDRDFGYQVSSVKRNDLHPVWNEDFAFSNIPGTLENMVLTLKVLDKDFGKRDNKCGKCKIKLDKEGISSLPKRIEKTTDRKLLRSNGKIVLDISYHP
uniref:C2 domain-containing protein n=1 Tax=Pseudo-nitzschia australis TaxID=44445 RepID=A0A7S4AJI6_9STRA|mmetsp:Transcript_4351/g.9417  ORF Transcript_4351/g.9417 Transcript_4351/m.9417 type:complete len:135 (+) Transcript_4351:119-523(+)|eukprot:CAMPEP_0168184742 /NCGR_PEP_ID=MMETSP0139_2-20121125/13412_1 /TAXON_ID=44445 /ORGANISM="Pseudo-nitzschia australis, Strain 10249 10 AB" /LENGTH=134 /DNA_ID=CAMNT_0008106405 /DNA_START=104 /DNA_END=508 /DNA_ORIENTATION=+